MSHENLNGLDELVEELARFEFEGAEKLSPIQFARYMGMAPQMVYYYLRNHVIEEEVCICGRRVVDVQSASEAIRTRQAEKKKRS